MAIGADESNCNADAVALATIAWECHDFEKWNPAFC
jgi:hypothetical protein